MMKGFCAATTGALLAGSCLLVLSPAVLWTNRRGFGPSGLRCRLPGIFVGIGQRTGNHFCQRIHVGEQSLLSRAHPPNLFQIPFEGSGDALFSLVERCICPRNSFSTAARMKALGLS